jgi:catechol 2,3-dioxygenase-like lactoylglutathione lyase family enzyme
MGMKKAAQGVRALAVVAMMAAGLFVVMVGWAGQTEGRAKILGIAYVKFKMTDPEKALDFYGGELGLVRAGMSGHGNKVDAQSFVVNQYQRVGLVTTAPGTGGSYLVEIGFATDDLAKMRTYLTAKGVAADKIMQRPDGTRYFETQDPEGNKIVFVEQKRNGKEEGTPGAISHKLIHAGFIVKDPAVEDRFYMDLLGFTAYWHGGMKEDETDWKSMQVPDGTDWIEYMLRVPANADKHTRGVMYHISLGVTSVAEAAKELETNGHEIGEPKIGRDGKWQLNLYDPDGTRVELMEFTPTGKTCCSEFMGKHPTP